MTMQPEVKLANRVSAAIAREILQASGWEVGGILLGRRSADEILVEDFEPVPCEHRLGRHYLLSEQDLEGLAESVEWFRALPASQASSGLEVLGLCRSRARPESSWNEHDEDLMRRFFADSGSLFVLVEQKLDGALDLEVFVFEAGTLRPRRAGSVGTRPSECPMVLPQSTRPRLQESEEAPDRSWWWVAGLVALTLVGAVLGYRSVGPPPAPPAPPAPVAQPQPAKIEQPAPPPEAPKVSPISEPSLSPAMERGIQSAIEQWQHAILSGDPELIAACYAPRLERARVRQAALRSFQHLGKPAILRVSDLSIAPLADDRAVATFRKHWQTRGPKVFAGEEQEKLVFVRVGEGVPPLWKIVSEEETKVYWTARPRTRGSGSR